MATNDNNSSLEVIDISSSNEPSPSSQKNNTSISGDNNSTVRIKQDPGASTTTMANSQEDDSDIEILTPSRFPKRPNSSGSNNINNNNNGCSSNMGMGRGAVDDDDDDIQVTSSNTINPNIDHPHARFHCGVHPFTLPPNVVFGDNNNNNTLSSNVNYCEKCYCFICDKLGKCVWGGTIRGLSCGNDKTFVKTRPWFFFIYHSIKIVLSISFNVKSYI